MTNDEKAQISERIEFIQVIIGSLDNVKSTENDITALPNPVNVTKDDADNINNALNLYNHLTEYQKTLIDANIKTKLNEVTKALSNLLLQDPASGIKVEGVDGTTFDTKTVLSVTSIKDTLDAQTKALFAIGVNNVAKGQEIVQLYDIQLQLNGQAIQPNGKVKITFKLTDEMKNYDNLQVVYIADDGTVTIIPFEQNGDEVSFITDHLSNYGIIGTPVKSNGNLNTGDNSSIVTYAVLGTTALLVIITISKRRRYKVAKKY